MSEKKEKISTGDLLKLATQEGVRVNRKIVAAGLLYGKECRASFDSMRKSVQGMLSARRELVQYLEHHQRTQSSDEGPAAEEASASEEGPLLQPLPEQAQSQCFGCAREFVGLTMNLLESMAAREASREALVRAGLLQELVARNIRRGAGPSRVSARKVVCALVRGSPAATRVVNEALRERLDLALDHHEELDVGALVRDDIEMLADACALDDGKAWELRIAFIGKISPAVCEKVVLPCLKILSDALQQPNNSTAASTASLRRRAEVLLGPLPQADAPSASESADPQESEDPHEAFLAEKYGRRWIAKWRAAKGAVARPPLLELVVAPSGAPEGALVDLMLCPSSSSIRAQATTLMRTVTTLLPHLAPRVLDGLVATLPTALQAPGEMVMNFFSLLQELLAPRHRRVRLAGRGFMQHLCETLSRESRRIESLEVSFTADITQGTIARTLAQLLQSFVDVPDLRQRFLDAGLLGSALRSFLTLRGLIVQKTKLTDDAAQILLGVLSAFREPSSAPALVRACAEVLSDSCSARAATFALEQLRDIVAPPKKEQEYELQLVKASTQEEFIRGSMTKNPYSTSDLGGPLMRHVKNRICETLDLRGLLDDDNGMELLVNNQIIKLDLPIKQVYEQVWRSNQGEGKPKAKAKGSPMKVVYRLQGLDGEATEPIIDSLREEKPEERDPEEEYAAAAVLVQTGAVEAVLATLGRSSLVHYARDREVIQLCLLLLLHCAKIAVGRERLEAARALDLAVNKLLQALSLCKDGKDSCADAIQPLLAFIEPLAESASAAAAGAPQTPAQSSTNVQRNVARIEELLGVLWSDTVRSTPTITQSIAKVLPLLTFGDERLSQPLVRFFLERVCGRLAEVDSPSAADSSSSSYALQCLESIASFIPMNEAGHHLRSLLLARGVTTAVVEHLRARNKAGELGSKSVTPCLRALTGLAKGHAAVQDAMLASGFVGVLHEIEQVHPTQTELVGLLAENLLDSLKDSPDAQREVEALRKAARDAKLKLAQQRRAQILSEMGLRSTGSGIVVAARPGSIEDIAEERGLVCVVCQEGHTLRPADALGVYVCSRPGPAIGYATSTLFNVIHFTCHDDATRAERRKKQPKEEWEAAAVRNQMVRCNGLFPVLGPAAGDEQYSAAVERYWAQLASSVRRADANRLRLLLHDLAGLLCRVAAAQGSSSASGGSAPADHRAPSSSSSSSSSSGEAGVRESNVKLAAFMVQMALSMAQWAASSAGAGGKRDKHGPYDAEKAFAAFASQPASEWTSAGSSSTDDAVYHAALALALCPAGPAWAEARSALARRVVARGVATLAGSRGQASGGSKGQEIAGSCRTGLLVLCLADRLRGALWQASRVAGGQTWPEWRVGAREALRDSKAVAESAEKALAAFDEETAQYEELSEFLDELGMLGEAAAGGGSEQWALSLVGGVGDAGDAGPKQT
eukprot:m51a1_g5495 hypothetical protein (1440) ;mRNA; f:338337-343290